jgi:serine protease Do
MKWKQLLLIAAISAGSALGGTWVYNKYFSSNQFLIGSAENGIPANYAGFFDGKPANPSDVVDLTKAANATGSGCRSYKNQDRREENEQ